MNFSLQFRLNARFEIIVEYVGGVVLGIIFTSFTTEVHQLYWRVKIRLTFKKGNVNSRLSGEMGSNQKTEK